MLKKHLMTLTICILAMQSDAFASDKNKSRSTESHKLPLRTTIKIDCGKRKFVSLVESSEEIQKSIVIYGFYETDNSPKQIDFSKDVTDKVSDEHRIIDAKLQCFAGKSFVGLFVPHSYDKTKHLYLMLQDDGRVMSGYNLTGDGIIPDGSPPTKKPRQ